jgi:hypothetical protein
MFTLADLSAGDFLFLTDANELTGNQKYRIAFWKYIYVVFCMSLIHIEQEENHYLEFRKLLM